MMRALQMTGSQGHAQATETECSHCRYRQFQQDPNLFRCGNCKRINMARMDHYYVVHNIDPFALQSMEREDRERMFAHGKREVTNLWWDMVQTRGLLILEAPRIDNGDSWVRMQGLVVHPE